MPCGLNVKIFPEVVQYISAAIIRVGLCQSSPVNNYRGSIILESPLGILGCALLINQIQPESRATCKVTEGYQ
jgi:hypothetical protein